MHLKNVCFFLLLTAAFSVFGQTGQTNSIEVDAAGNVRIDTPNLTVNGMEIIPRGAIIMWSGAKVPEGWILCDGKAFKDSDGETIVTPNLCGRFIVGYAPADPDYSKIGNVAGEKTHPLIEKEMPKHTHSIGNSGNHRHSMISYRTGWYDTGDEWNELGIYNRNVGTGAQDTEPAGDHTHGIGEAGNGEPHENRPPYYVLAYIMKIKGKGLGTTLTP